MRTRRREALGTAAASGSRETFRLPRTPDQQVIEAPKPKEPEPPEETPDEEPPAPGLAELTEAQVGQVVKEFLTWWKGRK